MNTNQQRTDWSTEDRELHAQYRDIVQLLEAANEPAVEPPKSLDRRIRQLARQRTGPDLQKNWLLGQGPWVILVTCILFAVAMLVLLGP